MTDYPREHMGVFGLLSGNENPPSYSTRQVLSLTCVVSSEEEEGGEDKRRAMSSFLSP